MTDYRIQSGEEMVGAGHSSKADTLNRLALIEHNSDGTHKYNITGLAYIDIRNYLPVGFVTDGSVDYSTQTQAAIDANKGKRILIPSGLTLLAAGVLLSGATYNNTHLVVEGTFKLKASAGASNFGGAWVGIIFKDCDNVTLELYDSDGNRANQTDSEYHHVIGLAGVTNFKAPYLSFRELRGDGIYISQSTWTSNTTNSSNVVLGQVMAINTADDGRNAVSVISCDGFHMDSLFSDKVGGVVNSVTMPGGLDIEPSQTYHSVTDVTVGTVNVTTIGTTGCAVLGKAVTNDATRDWNVSRVSISDFRVRNTSTTNSGPLFKRAADLDIKGSFSRSSTYNGISLDYLDRVKSELMSYNCSVGVIVGTDDWVNDFDIKVKVDTYSQVGLQTVGVQRGTFSGRVYGATSASSTFAIRTRSNSRSLTQSNIMYLVDAPYDGNNSRAFRNETGDTVAYTNCVALNCDWTGYANYSTQCDAQIPSKDVRGRNWITAMPNAGAWVQGDFVWRSNNSALDANNMFILGWMRLVTGTAHIDGTDWVTARVSNVSPAT